MEPFPVERKNNLPNLEDLDIKIIEFATNEDKEGIDYNQECQILFNGKILNLKIEEFSYKEPGSIDFIQVDIFMLDDTEPSNFSAKLSLEFKKDKGKYIALIETENKDRHLKGLGRALWKMGSGLIQKFADQKGVVVNHCVEKSPTSGLSSQKWDDLFLSILREYGYTKSVEGSWWEREYIPLNK